MVPVHPARLKPKFSAGTSKGRPEAARCPAAGPRPRRASGPDHPSPASSHVSPAAKPNYANTRHHARGFRATGIGRVSATALTVQIWAPRRGRQNRGARPHQAVLDVEVGFQPVARGAGATVGAAGGPIFS